MKEQSAVIQQDRNYYFSNNYLLGDLCWYVRLCRANKKSFAFCFKKKNGANWRAKMNYALTSINGH